MTYRVDDILNNWFGEPPEHSEHEQSLLRNLYLPLRRLEDELIELRKKAALLSWTQNPDRSGGQFTGEEIRESGQWR